jgi:AcrR family transcriptional regulator
MSVDQVESRRERTLATAAQLFATLGYHGTGVDEIGEAMGVTGPAIYRHFPNKQALLDAICLDGMKSLLEGAQRQVAERRPPRGTLEALVEMRVEFAFGPHRLAFPIHRNEEANLSSTVRLQIEELNNLYRAEWIRVLSQLRPDVSTKELHVAWLAAHVMIGFTAFREATVGPDELKPHLERMALAVILA